ncbi:MAG: thiolase domain-containing protein [archaeon]
MNKVAVIGTGMTKFGELWDKSLRDLIVEAGVLAMRDAGVTTRDIEALYGGNMSGGNFVKQEHLASLLADTTCLQPVPSVRVESACASGGLALRQAYLDIASGMHDIVVVGGVEKMTDVSAETATQVLATAADQEWESFYGLTFPGVYAMMARAHMNKYGTTEEMLSAVSSKSHHNGTMNPHAQFRYEVSIDAVLRSAMVADPLRLLHCSPLSDGGAAVILASEKKAKELSDSPVWILGSGHATDTIALHGRPTMTSLNAAIYASKQAYTQAGLHPKDIDLAEVHDCFSIAEIIATEDLGFFENGEGGRAALEGETALDGKIAINSSGGLKSKGHPVGATGIAQVLEIKEQLLNQAGKRQVGEAEIGMTHNVGGSGGSCLVHIFSR